MKSVLASLFVVFTALTASGGTFAVTNTNDSGPGSLRQAIIDANEDRNTPASVITFNIPGPGVHTINVLSPLPTLGNVTIDGYTQPAAKPNSLAVGTDAVLLIEITGNKSQPTGTAFQAQQFSTIRGLIINGFAIDVDIRSSLGFNAKVVGCYLETNAAGSALIPPAKFYTPINVNGAGLGATIGGLTPADRNVIAGPINIRQSNLGQPYTFASILGNYVGLSADGKSFLAPDASVGFFSNARAVVTNNVIAGFVTLSGSTGTITGNLIGTDALGTTASPGALGLDIFSFTSPGGGGAGAGSVIGNVIASVKSSSVVRLSKTGPSTLTGNWIGVAADGKTRLGNASVAIDLHDASNATIGGINSGDGNVIAFAAPAGQLGAGISEVGSTGHNFIEGNSITGSGGLGIDLAAASVTPNDAGDADGIQNYPVLSSAIFANGTVRVTGSLNSQANTSFRIELFGNDNADPSGYGQGQYYLGFANVTTDANGNASFDVTLPVPASATAISSTATGQTGTSEFSAALFAKLLNISSRANVKPGDDLMIGGFIITGTDPKRVLLRGIGPSLNIAGHLQDPVIALYDSSGSFILVNNNWKDSQQEEIEATGLAPNDRLDSAMLVTLPPAAYTVQLRGRDGGAGIALVEIYDLGQPGSRLANISTRARVESGDSVMIGGLIIGPNNGRNSRVVLRGLGPSLTGVPSPLPDPIMELWDGNGALLARNDNWKTNEAQIAPTGLAPTNDRESAIVADLAPGNYTAIVRDKESVTGVGLVEIYHL